MVVVDSTQEEVPIAYDNIDRMLKPSLIAESLMVPEVCDRTDGMGSLIHPNWILTAGHVATEISLENKVAFSDKTYSIKQIVVHPNFQNWSEGSREETFAENDIALIELTQSVEGIAPLPLYYQSNELDQIATFLGSGDFGTGLTGPDRVDAKLRKATNQIESVNEEWLTFEFNKPPEGTEIEGIPGPGDSGGPALLKVEGKWAIAGISSGQGNIQTVGEGHYGAEEYYTRVSQYTQWIEAVVKP